MGERRLLVCLATWLSGALLLGGGCQANSSTATTPPPVRGACAPDDLTCFLEGLQLTENGEPVELVDLPTDALPPTPDGGPQTTPGAPQITNQPSGFTLSGMPH